MASFENKKLALLRIFQILEKYSDENHCLTQKDISNYLSNQYQIQIERKTVARNYRKTTQGNLSQHTKI